MTSFHLCKLFLQNVKYSVADTIIFAFLSIWYECPYDTHKVNGDGRGDSLSS